MKKHSSCAVPPGKDGITICRTDFLGRIESPFDEKSFPVVQCLRFLRLPNGPCLPVRPKISGRGYLVRTGPARGGFPGTHFRATFSDFSGSAPRLDRSTRFSTERSANPPSHSSAGLRCARIGLVRHSRLPSPRHEPSRSWRAPLHPVRL